MDKLDAAVKKVNEPPPEMRVDLQISLNGRLVHFSIPLPVSAEEVIQLMTSLPGFIAQANSQYQATRGGGGAIALPNGQLVPVPVPTQPQPKES